MSDVLERLGAALAEHYAIERQVGAGGMATVYLARDLKHDRAVALKVLRPELAAVLGIERFLSEIRVTAHLQHPHILPLFDSGQAGGLIYYVMPHVEGESLRQRLEREKQLPIDEALRLAGGVASALDYAHRHGVIHRDIKPENILFQDGQAVVADFGIALALSAAGGSRLTETGLSLGTPQYMSPEQATGDRLIDARSDIYSLASVLYEMLAGEPPHNGPTATAATAAGVRTPARRGRGPEGAGQGAGGPVPNRGGVRGRAGAAGVGGRDARAPLSARRAGCRAMGGRRGRDRARALGLAPSATRAACTAGGAVHAGPAAERATGRGGPDRRVVPGWLTDRVCQLRSHRQSAVQPQARPAGARAPRRYAERTDPFLLAGRTVGGLLLERQAVQAAAGWGSGDHGRQRVWSRVWSDVGVDRHDSVPLGRRADGGARRGGRAAAPAQVRHEPRRILCVPPLPAGWQGAAAPDPIPGGGPAGGADARDRQAQALRADGQQPAVRILRPRGPGHADGTAARSAVRPVAPRDHGIGGACGGWGCGRTGRRGEDGDVPGRRVCVRVRAGGPE